MRLSIIEGYGYLRIGRCVFCSVSCDATETGGNALVVWLDDDRWQAVCESCFRLGTAGEADELLAVIDKRIAMETELTRFWRQAVERGEIVFDVSAGVRRRMKDHPEQCTCDREFGDELCGHGRTTIGLCHACHHYWVVGDNLFSEWRYQPPPKDTYQDQMSAAGYSKCSCDKEILWPLFTRDTDALQF